MIHAYLVTELIFSWKKTQCNCFGIRSVLLCFVFLKCLSFYLIRTHDTEMVALLNLGPFALGRASESVAGIAMFLKLPVRELDIAVLHEAVQAEGVFVGTVEHNHSVSVPGTVGVLKKWAHTCITLIFYCSTTT